MQGPLPGPVELPGALIKNGEIMAVQMDL
jgi:hypothetical protein